MDIGIWRYSTGHEISLLVLQTGTAMKWWGNFTMSEQFPGGSLCGTIFCVFASLAVVLGGFICLLGRAVNVGLVSSVSCVRPSTGKFLSSR